jgi:RecA-family ATPase
LANDDAILALPADGRGNGALVATPLYQEIDGLLAENRPALLVLDTLADIYGGNEIVRAQVRQFINMLRRLALNYDSTVVVLARIRASPAWKPARRIHRLEQFGSIAALFP